MAVLGVGAVLVTLSVSIAIGWDVNAICPGTATFCKTVWWRTVVDYLPAWLFLGQILVALTLGSPWAIIRLRG